jgi:hypothetical protein
MRLHTFDVGSYGWVCNYAVVDGKEVGLYDQFTIFGEPVADGGIVIKVCRTDAYGVDCEVCEEKVQNEVSKCRSGRF